MFDCFVCLVVIAWCVLFLCLLGRCLCFVVVCPVFVFFSYCLLSDAVSVTSYWCCLCCSLSGIIVLCVFVVVAVRLFALLVAFVVVSVIIV